MGVGPTNPSLRMEKGRSSSCQPIIATNKKGKPGLNIDPLNIHDHFQQIKSSSRK
jgi:hypothetical protein